MNYQTYANSLTPNQFPKRFSDKKGNLPFQGLLESEVDVSEILVTLTMLSKDQQDKIIQECRFFSSRKGDSIRVPRSAIQNAESVIFLDSRLFDEKVSPLERVKSILSVLGQHLLGITFSGDEYEQQDESSQLVAFVNDSLRTARVSDSEEVAH